MTVEQCRTFRGVRVPLRHGEQLPPGRMFEAYSNGSETKVVLTVAEDRNSLFSPVESTGKPGNVRRRILIGKQINQAHLVLNSNRFGIRQEIRWREAR